MTTVLINPAIIFIDDYHKKIKKVPAMNRNRREAMTQTSAAHRETLRKNVQRRIESARARGDDQLVRQLEAEASYIG
jgi:ribosome-binding protein aMBF1 (putative translation factor)